MKTLREYIDLIDGKSNVSEADIGPNSVAAIVKAATNAATSGGFGPALMRPRGGFLQPIAEIDKENKSKSKSLVDFSDSDKYDNFVAPDEDEAEDYKAGTKGHKKIRDTDVYGRNGFSDAAAGTLGPN